MSSCSALVQPEETTCGWSTPNTYQDLLMREHAAAFSAAELLYGAIESPGERDKLSLLHSCRVHAWFVRNELTGEVRIRSDSCGLRWCPMCQQARQNYIAQQISPWLCRVNYPKLLTLTLRHTSKPLQGQVEFLYQCFQKFRKRKYISSMTAGGVWFFQVKKSKDNWAWHPHLHVLLDSEFMDRKILSKIWKDVTGGSSVIDIRSIDDTDRAVKHHARYCAGPTGLVDLELHEQLELYDCFKGRRLVGCFGSAKRISLRPRPPADSDHWENIGSWSNVIHLQGDDFRADAILHAWKTKLPLPLNISLSEFERELSDLPPPKSFLCAPSQYVLDFYK